MASVGLAVGHTILIVLSAAQSITQDRTQHCKILKLLEDNCAAGKGTLDTGGTVCKDKDVINSEEEKKNGD